MAREALTAAQERAIKAWLEAEFNGEGQVHPENLLGPSDKSALGLTEGDRVAIQLKDRLLSGTVDCIASDGSIFWIWQDAGAGRTAIHDDDYITVTLVHRPEPSKTDLPRS